MQRISGVAAARNIKLIVLSQPQASVETAANIATKDRILDCARRNGALIADLFPALAALPAQERDRLFFPKGHMTPHGNRFTAAHLRTIIDGYSGNTASVPGCSADVWRGTSAASYDL